MELKEFIEATLKQVLEGVEAAQASEGNGKNINANIGFEKLGGKLINAGDYGTVTRVDFDVSVSAESSGGGGAKVIVFGIGFEGGKESKAGFENRISFSVPVRLPDGDKARAKKIESEQAQARTRKDYKPLSGD